MLGVVAALVFGPPTVAATATTSFLVTATVQATCGLSATNLAFGPYVGAQLDATASVTITCTSTTPYNVGLDNGLYGRQMNGPAASRIPYDLFSDNARTVRWVNSVGVNTVAGTGNGAAQPLTIYGRITAGQFKNPGAYTDTVTATVTY